MKRIHPILAVCVLLAQIQAIADDIDGNSPLHQVKDHHFFVGVDLSIPHGDQFYPIERIWNAHAQIRVGDAVVVEEIQDLKEFRFTRSTKISRHFAEITDLKCDPAFSINTDPQVMALGAQNQAATLADDTMSLQESTIRMVYSMPGSANSAVPDDPYLPSLPADVVPEIDMGLGSASNSHSRQLEFYQQQMAGEMPVYDALRIRFSLKSDSYFPRGHLAFIFHLRDGKDDSELKTWIHFLSLKDISPEDQSYDYFVTSYPDGMRIESQEVFLFANGSEIATNLSPKHVEMTAADARMYLNYQYLSRNEGKTKPPERLWNYLSQDFRKSVHAGLRDDKITLMINEDGVVTDLIMNPAVSAALNPANIREISSQLYLPALENGKPVNAELVLLLKHLVF